MNIEFEIVGNDNVLLSPIQKISEDGIYTNFYELKDALGKSWIELELKNNSFYLVSKDSSISENEEDIKNKLDQLVLSVIEAQQSGTENTESEIIEDISPYDPDKIKVHSKQFSVKLIAEMIDNGDIDFTPDFQRNLVWDSHQKSRLIESILLRIPLPMFYLAEDEEGRITVVDGLQRLTAIKEFMDNKLALKGLQYLKEANGRYYNDKNKDGSPSNLKCIEPKYFRWFNMTQFSVNVIDPSSPAKVKYDIFRRINTGGKPLNNQEIRNCLASKNLRETIHQMINLPEFKSATDKSIKSIRMEDQEVALRFICFYRLFKEDNTLSNYSGIMESTLDDLTEELGKFKKEELYKFVTLFSNAMKNAEYLFSSRYAFRKILPVHLRPDSNKQLINKALFVSCSVLLCEYEYEKVILLNDQDCLIKPLAELISSDISLWGFLSYGTNGKSNIQYVFGAIEGVINSNLKS